MAPATDETAAVRLMSARVPTLTGLARIVTLMGRVLTPLLALSGESANAEPRVMPTEARLPRRVASGRSRVAGSAADVPHDRSRAQSWACGPRTSPASRRRPRTTPGRRGRRRRRRRGCAPGWTAPRRARSPRGEVGVVERRCTPRRARATRRRRPAGRCVEVEGRGRAVVPRAPWRGRPRAARAARRAR